MKWPLARPENCELPTFGFEPHTLAAEPRARQPELQPAVAQATALGRAGVPDDSRERQLYAVRVADRGRGDRTRMREKMMARVTT